MDTLELESNKDMVRKAVVGLSEVEGLTTNNLRELRVALNKYFSGVGDSSGNLSIIKRRVLESTESEDCDLLIKSFSKLGGLFTKTIQYEFFRDKKIKGYYIEFCKECERMQKEDYDE